MIDDSLGFLLAAASRLSKREFEKKLLKKYQITVPQWAVLCLLCQEGSLPQTQIADKLYGDKATIGDIVDKLLAKGLVERTVSTSDKRAYCVSATEKAKQRIGRMAEMTDQVNEMTYGTMSPGERMMLQELLKKVITNLSGVQSGDEKKGDQL